MDLEVLKIAADTRNNKEIKNFCETEINKKLKK